MIYDVINLMDNLAKDSLLGLNVQVAAVDAKYTARYPNDDPLTTPLFVRDAQFHIWDLSQMPGQMILPSFQVVFEGTPVWKPRSQLKWIAHHTVSWNIWINESRDSASTRRALLVYMHALGLMAEELPGYTSSGFVNNTIEEYSDPRVHVSGWQMAGKMYTFMSYTFLVQEKDEEP